MGLRRGLESSENGTSGISEPSSDFEDLRTLLAPSRKRGLGSPERRTLERRGLGSPEHLYSTARNFSRGLGTYLKSEGSKSISGGSLY
ncbi:unnamed protein product [Didymodactylos carnosus]|uniref:Uncharacterized protein n=1 Tax=Didymodactylos carnosus TaxID=1234261 RepID=A0A814QJD5_9BILA|nr:unnamed protein product [Didymodactylos carnosus]CAF3883907.1 unnamed protein product [Didymodactylos carnosus]